MLNFQDYSLWIVILAFTVASGFVWAAGTRLSRYLDRIAEVTGIGGGLIGLVLLGGITSLPEVATASTASLMGNASLAISNLLGSVAINIVLLALADAMLGKEAITSVVGKPAPMLQGTLNILVLTVVVAAIATGDYGIAGLGVWSTLLVPLYAFSIWLTSKYEHRRSWTADGRRQDGGREQAGSGESRGQRGGNERRNSNGEGQSEPGDGDGKRDSLRWAIIKTCIAAFVILVAGYVLARSGDAIATKTGIGSGLIGLVLVGFATSLPEISSIYAAVKLKRYNMVLGDIFGTNLFNVVLIFWIDVLYSGPPILTLAGTFEALATLLGIALSAIYLIGLIEREDRTVWRMGYPSLAVVATYLAGIGVLSFATSSG